MCKILKRNIEMVVMIILALIILSISFYYKDYLSGFFIDDKLDINGQILSIFGGLFGMILTAYAIFVGIVPAIDKKFKKTEAYRKINTRFFIATISSLGILILSFVTLFQNQTARAYFIPFQLALCTFIVGMLFLLATYLFLIFRNLLIR